MSLTPVKKVPKPTMTVKRRVPSTRIARCTGGTGTIGAVAIRHMAVSVDTIVK